MPEPPESRISRAELLADLGRYDEAAAELVDAPAADAAAHTLLARIRLAAGSPAGALAAADTAVAAAPADLPALIARGMALADLGRVDEAAAQAEQILRRGRGDGYACTSAAAILAAGRTGQVALDAAWEGVRLTPDQPRAHLVLGVVASRLGLRQIAARAYQEALALDPQLPVAQPAQGIARAEQHRYAVALSHLDKPPRRNRPPGPADPPRPVDPARPADPAVPGEPAVPRPGPAGTGLGRLLGYGTGYAVVAPLLVALAFGYGFQAPLVALVLAGVGLAGGWLAWRRLPELDRADLPEQVRADRSIAVLLWSVLAVPALLFGFALSGSPWLLAAAVVTGLVALPAYRARRPRPR